MKKGNIRAPRKLRNKVLSAAILSALTLGASGGVLAQSAEYQLDTTTWTQGIALSGFLQDLGNAQYLDAAVAATLPAGSSVFIIGPMSGVPLVNSDNLLRAGTFGASGVNGANNAANAIGMSLLGDDGTNAGIGILSGQVLDNAPVTAAASGAVVTNVDGFTSGTITHSSNTIQAAATLNGASSTVAGDLPGGFAGTTPGDVAFEYDAAPMATASADIVVANMQSAAGSDSSATATDAAILVIDTAASPLALLDVDVAVDGNTIRADYAGNASDNRIEALDGTLFEGSAALVNGQSNARNAGTLALVDNGSIGGSLGGALDGSLGVSGGSISATGGSNAAGNLVGFADGIDIAGSSANAVLALQGPNIADADGDLVLLSSQRTLAGLNEARVDNGAILGSVAHLEADSTLSMGEDGISATAIDNRAANRMHANAAGAITANVAVGNQQTSEAGVAVSARTSGGMIAAAVLGDSTNPVGGLDDQSGGSVTVAGAGIASLSRLNSGSTSVYLGAANFVANDGTAALVATTSGEGLVDAGTAGVAIGTLQIATGNATSATTTGTDAFGTHGAWIGAYYNGGMLGASATVDGNAVSSDAGANEAATEASVTGANGSLNAQLGSVQQADGNFGATVDDAVVGVYLGGGSADGSGLVVDANQVRASGSGNRASNDLDVGFANLAVGNPVANPWSTPTLVADSTSIAGNAVFAVASSQELAGDTLTGTISDGFIGAEIGEHPWPGVPGDDLLRGNILDSAVTVSGNGVAATARGNEASNGLHLESGNLATASGASEQIAALGNTQLANDNLAASVTAVGPDVRDLTQVGVIAHRDLAGAVIAVSGNGLQAFTAANIADNELTSNGGAYAPAPAAGGDAGYVAGASFGSAATASAGFALLNLQQGSGDRGADVLNGNVGLRLTDGSPTDRHAVAGGSITISDNTVAAEVRDNAAANRLGLGVAYDVAGNPVASPLPALGTTATLGNVQGSDTSQYSRANSLLGMLAGHYDVTGVDITVSGNTVSSRAMANTAVNRLDVAASQLTGDSSDGSGSPIRGAISLAGSFQARADYALASSQDHIGAVEARLNGAGDEGTGIGVGIGEGTLADANVTITGNTQLASAQANTVSNALGLTGTTVEASSALLSQQLAQSSVVATGGQAASPGLEGGLGFALQVQGAIVTTTSPAFTIADNQLVVHAGLNDGANAVRVTGDSAVPGFVGQTIGLDLAGIIGMAGAYNSLASMQLADGSASASAQPGLSGIEVVGNEANALSSTIGGNSGSAMTVQGNAIAATANLNRVANAVELEGATVGATAVLLSQQLGSGTSDAATSATDVGIYNRDSGMLEGGAIAGATMTVSDNQLVAAASVNAASNTLAVLPTALNTAPDAFAGALVMGAGGPGLSVGGANYVAINAQSSSATSTAALNDSSIGVNADAGTANARGSASPLLNGVATVSGNSAIASASANSASNSLLLASTSELPSAALVNTQASLAPVSAIASGVSIGVHAGGLPGMGTSPATIIGNVISAAGVGNSAINQIGTGG
jgi:hypothetical protein